MIACLLLSSVNTRGPMKSRHASTTSLVSNSVELASRSVMSLTSGESEFCHTSYAKLTLSTIEPLLIHSFPSCQPSTEGGFNSDCPIYSITLTASFINNVGLLITSLVRRQPATYSAGHLTLSNLEFLKNSDLNRTLNISVISCPSLR